MKHLILFMLLCVTLVSCNKDKKLTTNNPPPPTVYTPTGDVYVKGDVYIYLAGDVDTSFSTGWKYLISTDTMYWGYEYNGPNTWSTARDYYTLGSSWYIQLNNGNYTQGSYQTQSNGDIFFDYRDQFGEGETFYLYKQ